MFTFKVKDILLPGAAPHFVAPAKTSSVTKFSWQHSQEPTKYSVLSQSRTDLDDPENSPSISMWGYLLTSAQTQLLNEISIYAEPGTSPDKMRFLYMNDRALIIWEEMKKSVHVIGRLRRPPRSAVLSFGVPFSE